jgi:apolipoprotein N-acyltransferase
MNRIAHFVILAYGWKRVLMAVAVGALAALAMPPFGFLPALALSFPLCIWMLDGCVAAGRWRRISILVSAFGIGWAFGFGYFVAGLWWLGAAFLVEADQFAWAMPLGVVGLPAVLAFFPAFGFALARMLWTDGTGRILAFGFALALSEYLRSVLLTGFPWNNLGMALGQHLWLMQGASLIGLHGLTLLTILMGASFALSGADHRSFTKLYAGPALALLVLAGLAVYGAQRVPAGAVPEVKNVRLRIMQPNLPQDDTFNAANREEIMRRYLSLSDRATSPTTTGITDVTHLIWPESAFPYLLHRDARALAQIAGLLPPGVTLVTGAARAGDALPGETGTRYYNSLHAIAHDGVIVSTYDKRHLVPFGEYLPPVFDRLLRAVGLKEFVAIPGGFEAGSSGAVFAIPGLPRVAATICYEAIFPRAAISSDKRPGWILNVTNDAWFGMTPGPRQHFAQARLRAVEEGVPLVRAANNGISAIIDPYGRIIHSLDLGLEGVVDGGLPDTISPTLYARFTDLPFWILLICTLGTILIFRKGRRI